MSVLRLVKGGEFSGDEGVDHEAELIERSIASYWAPTEKSDEVDCVGVDSQRSVPLDFESTSFKHVGGIVSRLLSGESDVLGVLNISPRFTEYVSRRFGSLDRFFDSQVWVNLLIESFRRVYVPQISLAAASYGIESKAYDARFKERLRGLGDESESFNSSIDRDSLEMDVNSIQFQVDLVKSFIMAVGELCSKIPDHELGMDNLMGFPYVQGSKEGREVYEGRMINHGFKMAEEGTEMSTIFCDVDGFKGFNSVYEYAWANKVLRKVAKIARRCLRDSDEKFRYGGEEIVFFVPGGDLELGQRLAERLRVAVEESPIYCFAHLSFSLIDGTGRKIPLSHDDVFTSEPTGEVECSMNHLKMVELEEENYKGMSDFVLNIKCSDSGRYFVDDDLDSGDGLSPMMLEAVGRLLDKIKGLRPQDEFKVVVNRRRKSIALIAKGNITISFGVNSFQLPNDMRSAILESKKMVPNITGKNKNQLEQNLVGFFDQAITHAAGLMNQSKAEGKNCVRSAKFE